MKAIVCAKRVQRAIVVSRPDDQSSARDRGVTFDKVMQIWRGVATFLLSRAPASIREGGSLDVRRGSSTGAWPWRCCPSFLLIPPRHQSRATDASYPNADRMTKAETMCCSHRDSSRGRREVLCVCVDEHNQEKTSKRPRLNSPDAGCGLLSKGGQVPNPQPAQPAAPTAGRRTSATGNGQKMKPSIVVVVEKQPPSSK